jgi:hypothetical protein
MGRWSVAHRTIAVLFYYEAKSVIQAQRRLRQQFNVPRHGVIPSHNRILQWIRKVEDTGSVRDSPHRAPRRVRTEMFAEQRNHFSAVHFAQICNINVSWA